MTRRVVDQVKQKYAPAFGLELGRNRARKAGAQASKAAQRQARQPMKQVSGQGPFV